MLIRLLTRLRLIRYGNCHAGVNEELRFRLEQEIEANIAKSMPPAETRKIAGVAFGGVENICEQCREQRPGYWLETLDIGATTGVFRVVDRILFRALPYGEGDRLVSVGLVAPIELQEFLLSGFYCESASPHNFQFD